jgi:hypothetical protein
MKNAIKKRREKIEMGIKQREEGPRLCQIISNTMLR